ncbi:MAG: glutamate-5-semialdehyde dehydrogenase [Acidobacteriota bacterium]
MSSTDSLNLKAMIHGFGTAAKAASRTLRTLDRGDKDAALHRMADVLYERRETILKANSSDVQAAEATDQDEALVDRLRLDESRLQGVIEAVRQVAELDDPVGATLREWSAAQGVRLQKVRVPIGVIGIIYESRPNVTIDAATLCFKAGNAVILRGGSEAIHTNSALAVALVDALVDQGLHPGCISFVPFTDREGVRHMAEMDECLDLIIPRGGHKLIETVVSLARMPVLKHYNGVCHVYVDATADLEMAAAISENAKVQRPGVCNAMETLLVHRDVAADFLPAHAARLQELGVEIRGDEAVCELVPSATPATAADWPEEYLDLILAVRVVDSLDEATAHIARYGSSHTEAIVTEDEEAAERFLAEVDSSTVLWNASTRFADGGEFGFGAEIGISTDKLHARGPMALEELTIYKYVARGTGQVRS